MNEPARKWEHAYGGEQLCNALLNVGPFQVSCYKPAGHEPSRHACISYISAWGPDYVRWDDREYTATDPDGVTETFPNAAAEKETIR